MLEPGQLVEHPFASQPGLITRVFESLDSFRRHNNNTGFWPLEASIDWCERNYVITEYIAEFFNTISNFPLVLVGLLGVINVLSKGFEPRFAVVYACLFLVGVGSVAYHSTLTKIGQQGDESPMILAITSWIYCLVVIRPDFERRHPRFCWWFALVLTIADIAYVVSHWFMCYVVFHQVLFGCLMVTTAVLVVREIEWLDGGACKTGKQLGYGYIVSLFGAAFFWLMDQIFCEQLHDLPYGLPNPQFHAVWHLGTATASWSGTMFLMWQRAKHLGQQPRLVMPLGMMEVVGGAGGGRSDGVHQHRSRSRSAGGDVVVSRGRKRK